MSTCPKKYFNKFFIRISRLHRRLRRVSEFEERKQCRPRSNRFKFRKEISRKSIFSFSGRLLGTGGHGGSREGRFNRQPAAGMWMRRRVRLSDVWFWKYITQHFKVWFRLTLISKSVLSFIQMSTYLSNVNYWFGLNFRCSVPVPCLSYEWGRLDCSTSPTTDVNREFPSAEMSADQMYDYFKRNFGFSKQEVSQS